MKTADFALIAALFLPGNVYADAKNGVLKVYENFPHGMCTTHADVVNPELLAFIKGAGVGSDRANAEPVDAAHAA